MRDSGKKKGWAFQIIRGILLFLLFLIFGASAVFGVLYYSGKKNLTKKEGTPRVIETAPEETRPAWDTELLDEDEISYKGVRYRYRDSLINILCMGVDQKSISQEKVYGNGGQADAIALVSLDTETGQITVLNISRDTMTDVNLYTKSGMYAGMEKRQLCLAYAYGDGRHGSCENMQLAVSRLLYGVPIQGYAAVSISAIPVLNEAVGGVEVTLSEEAARVLTKYSPGSYEAGETILLDDETVYDFVHFREYEGDAPIDANNARMARQKQYISSFVSKVMSQSLSDLSVPVRLFEIMEEYTVTDLTVSDISYLAAAALKNGGGQFCMETVPGSVVRGEDGYAQYLVEEQELREMVLKLFYRSEQTE